MGALLMLLVLPWGQLSQAAGAPSQRAITLRWKEVVETNCRTDDDTKLGMIRIVGTIVFENRSQKPILLLRQPHSSGEVRLQAMNPDLAHKSQYTFSPLNVQPNAPVARRYELDAFVRLRSNESYTEPFSFSFFFRKPENKTELGLPPAGDYRASVQISVWPDAMDEASRIERAGRVQVWTESLWSEPILVQVRADGPVHPCP